MVVHHGREVAQRQARVAAAAEVVAELLDELELVVLVLLLVLDELVDDDDEDVDVELELLVVDELDVLVLLVVLVDVVSRHIRSVVAVGGAASYSWSIHIVIPLHSLSVNSSDGAFDSYCVLSHTVSVMQL